MNNNKLIRPNQIKNITNSRNYQILKIKRNELKQFFSAMYSTCPFNNYFTSCISSLKFCWNLSDLKATGEFRNKKIVRIYTLEIRRKCLFILIFVIYIPVGTKLCILATLASTYRFHCKYLLKLRNLKCLKDKSMTKYWHSDL